MCKIKTGVVIGLSAVLAHIHLGLNGNEKAMFISEIPKSGYQGLT